jgi:glycosyltransferase involved in cell wall biosynthesis
MLDLSVIILTYNEGIHIRRCIENIKSIAKNIFVVDSFSTDKTIEIAESLGAKVHQNP